MTTVDSETLGEAAEVSLEAADRANVTVRNLDALGEFGLAASLFSRVWAIAPDESSKVPVDLLRAMTHAGGYVAGAWAGDDLVGAALGWGRLGGSHPALHSHLTGVLRGAAGAGA